MAQLYIHRAVIPATKQYKFRCPSCGFADQFILGTVGESAVSYQSGGLSHMMESLFGTQSEKAQLKARANAIAELDRTQRMVACPKCKAPRASRRIEQMRIILGTLVIGVLVWLATLVIFWMALMMLLLLLSLLPPPPSFPGDVFVVLALAVPIGLAVYRGWQHGKAGFDRLATLDARAAFWTINPERWTTSFGEGGVLSRLD